MEIDIYLLNLMMAVNASSSRQVTAVHVVCPTMVMQSPLNQKVVVNTQPLILMAMGIFLNLKTMVYTSN